MAHKHTSDRPQSSKGVCSRSQKMRLSHEKTRKQIRHILAENADRIATGKPLHVVQKLRR